MGCEEAKAPYCRVLSKGQCVPVLHSKGSLLGWIASVVEQPDGRFDYEVLLDNGTYEINVQRESLGAPVDLRDPVMVLSNLMRDLSDLDVFVLVSKLHRLIRSQVSQEHMRGSE